MKKLAALALFTGAAFVVPAQTFYENVTTFQGRGFANSGAALESATSSNSITNLVADDITVGAGQGQDVYAFSFNIMNFNNAAVLARARIGFYDVDAVSGLPTTYLDGITFNPISFPAAQEVTYTAVATTPIFRIPISGRFWAGITFDNNSNMTGATIAQLNNLGQGLYNPPVFGSSANLVFRTTTNGSFLANNPAGTTFSITNGTLVANFGWRFAGVNGFTPVPEPATMAALGLGVLALLKRRRRVK